MNVAKRLMMLFLMLLLTIALSACGSSGGGDDDNTVVTPKTAVLKGVVTDGPIDGAVVTLHKKNGDVSDLCKSGKCEVKSIKGAFSFSFKKDVTQDEFFGKGYYIKASGGVDTELGNIPAEDMSAPLDMFTKDSSEKVNVTPVTTLVKKFMASDNSVTMEQAKKKVSSFTGVPEDKTGDVPASGSSEDKSFKSLTFIAKLSDKGFGSAGFVESMKNNKALYDDKGVFNTTDGSAFDSIVPDTSKEDAKTALGEINTGKNPSTAFSKHSAKKLVFNVVKSLFNNKDVDADFETNKDFYVSNSALIASKLMKLENFSLDSSSAYKAVKYVVRKYSLVGDSGNKMGTKDLTEEDLTRSVEGSENKIKLDADSELNNILKNRVKYYVKTPLLESELPGDDNKKRSDYYFYSDISHLKIAESVIGSVLDDEVNDTINQSIVKSLAENGYYDRAKEIINHRMFRTQNKGTAWYYIGHYYYRLGETAKAEEALKKAEEEYKLLITSKGEGNADARDAGNIQSLSALYRDNDNNEASKALLEYFDGVIAEIQGIDPTTFGRLAVALKFSADDYMEDGDLVQAMNSADAFYKMAKLAPESKGSYRTKIFYLSWAVELYGALKAKDKALDAYNTFQATRLIKEKDFDKTWFFTKYAAAGLADAGLDAELKKLMEDTFKEGSTAPSYVKEDMVSLYVTVIGTGPEINALELAYAKLDELTDDDALKEQIQSLTYNGGNPKTPFLAMKLINKGEKGKALKVTAKAEEIVDKLYPDPASEDDYDIFRYKIYFGYLKIANLYRLAGNSDSALDSLDKAVKILAKFKGNQYRVEGLCKTAMRYYEHNDKDKAEAIIKEAEELTKNQAITDSDSAKIVGIMYKDIINTWFNIKEGEKSLGLIDGFVSASEKIFDEETDDPENPGKDREIQLDVESRNLIKAANYLIWKGKYEKAGKLLVEAERVARLMYDQKKMVKLIIGDSGVTFDGIAMAYVQSNETEKALKLVNSISLYSKKKEGLLMIAKAFGYMDRFAESDIELDAEHPEWWVATVDTDGDGKPNFFSPSATDDDIANSGLVLDDDCDGDGIPDTDDLRPLFADN